MLHPHLGPPYDDANNDPAMACVFANGEGKTFIAMDGAWSVRCKAWVDGSHQANQQHRDFHVIRCSGRWWRLQCCADAYLHAGRRVR